MDAPLAVIFTAVPEQTEGEAGLKIITGGEMEETATVEEVTGSQTNVVITEYAGNVICQFAIVPVFELALS